jgi:hypothetical protein
MRLLTFSLNASKVGISSSRAASARSYDLEIKYALAVEGSAILTEVVGITHPLSEEWRSVFIQYNMRRWAQQRHL